MNNNLEVVNITYESSNTNQPANFNRRRASLTRSRAKRNVSKNNKTVRRFSLGNKGNVKAINKNTLRLKAFAQALANAPESKHNAMLAHMNNILKKTRRRR
jgi:hypothetical protein